MSTSTFYFQGNQVTATEFIKKLFNTITLPNILKSEEELREMWSSPITRNTLLKKLEELQPKEEKLDNNDPRWDKLKDLL